MQPSTPSTSQKQGQGMTTARAELGISPVLFQAIAQLTASSSTSSNQPGGAGTHQTADTASVATSLIKQAHANSRDMEGDQMTTNKDTNRVVSQLLQKLNEPVNSLIPQSTTTRSASQLLLTTANMNQASAVSDSNKQSSSPSITQAGLSMLGLASDNNAVNPNELTVMSGMVRTNVLGDELNNFLLKQEPVEDDITPSSSAKTLPSGRAINTDVSSVLSALASQHAQQQQQQSMLQKGGDASAQQQQSVTSLQLQNTTFHIIHPNQTPPLNTSTTRLFQQASDSPTQNFNSNMVNINTASSSSVISKNQEQQQQPQQIIIYGMQYDNNNIITAPNSAVSTTLQSSRMVSDCGDNGNLIIEEGASEVAAGTNGQQQTTFRLQVQSSPSSSSVGNNSNSININNAASVGSQKTLVISASDGSENIVHQPLPGPSGGEAKFDVMPVSDVQNSFEGMNMPCPICGDKVSGYHYGIFSCESCKGFFKRTVQNKKTFVCPKESDCVITSINRKKCPACRFKRCLQMGMKLEAIRQDRTRGGRSSYEGCTPHKARPAMAMMRKQKRAASSSPRVGGDPMLAPAGSSSQEVDDGSISHRNLVAILNHNAHKQGSPGPGEPVIPELLRDIMNLEPLLSDDDVTPESIMEATTFPDQALYSYMMQLAELRLYKLVRWARNLPQFGAISTDDQILLLQNCWSELIGLALCWRSIDTPNQISISSTHHITAEWAQHIGCEDLVSRLLSISTSFRNLYMDEYEYVALKVLLLISPDVKGLKEPRKIRDFQDKLLESLMVYTESHYDMKNKFGEMLLRLPELSRLSFLSKNILLKHLPTSSSTCGLLVELLKGDSRLEQQQQQHGESEEGGGSGILSAL